MRLFLFGALIFLNVSCATLSNRRDLYRPNQEDELSTVTNSGIVRTTTTTRTTRKPATPVPPPPGPITPDDEPVLPP